MTFQELNPVIKYLYYSDVIFHDMIVNRAEELDKIPYDMMLKFNTIDNIDRLVYISERKRMYENMLFQKLHRSPLWDWENDGLFKITDELYSNWNKELEEFIRETLI